MTPSGHLKKKAAVEPGGQYQLICQKYGLAIELAKELSFLRRQVNGYFVVPIQKMGALAH